MNIYKTIQGRVLTHCLYITASSNTITHTAIHLGACSWGHFESVVIRLLIAPPSHLFVESLQIFLLSYGVRKLQMLPFELIIVSKATN